MLLMTFKTSFLYMISLSIIRYLLRQAVLILRSITKKTTRRNLELFQLEAFLTDLSEIMNENNTKNLYITPGGYLFRIFIEKFESVLNKHALLKELSRTELKFRSEPWLTKGIRNSTKTKNTLYKISKKRYSPERFQRYKMYRNSFNSCEGKVQKIVLQQFI